MIALLVGSVLYRCCFFIIEFLSGTTICGEHCVMSSPDPPPNTQAETSGQDAQAEALDNRTADATTMELDKAGAKKMRVLAVYCVNDESEDDKGFDPPDSSNVLHLAARPGVEVSSKQQHRCYHHNFEWQQDTSAGCHQYLLSIRHSYRLKY